VLGFAKRIHVVGIKLVPAGNQALRASHSCRDDGEVFLQRSSRVIVATWGYLFSCFLILMFRVGAGRANPQPSWPAESAHSNTIVGRTHRVHIIQSSASINYRSS